MTQNPHKIRFTVGEADMKKVPIQKFQSETIPENDIERKKRPVCDCNVTIIFVDSFPSEIYDS